jgi:hypothetical protein
LVQRSLDYHVVCPVEKDSVSVIGIDIPVEIDTGVEIAYGGTAGIGKLKAMDKNVVGRSAGIISETAVFDR